MTKSIRFHLNGRPTTLQTDENRLLLWVLRTDLGLTGTKCGCAAGHCGSCTVLVDGEATRSCVTSLGEVQGKEVTTIEGLAPEDGLHPLQEAFIERGAFQCGFCTPGMIMSAHDLLRRDPRPTREAILQAMEGNLCRCGAHQRIVAAIEAASRAEGGRQ